MKFHRTLTLALVALVALVMAPATAMAFGDYHEHHNDYSTNDYSTTNNEGGTGIGVGVGVGGDADASVNIGNGMFNKVLSPEVDVDVDNDIDIDNTDVTIQGQCQTQKTKQANTQETNVTFEDKIQHPGIGSLGHGVDLLAPPTPSSFHNNVWLDPSDMTMTTAMALDIAHGYHWGTKTTVKKMGYYKATSSIQELATDANVDPDMIGVVTVRGNPNTKGYEVEAEALRIAMEMGGRYFIRLTPPSYEVVGRSVNVGPSGGTSLSDVSNHDGKMAVSGSGAGFFNWGSAAVKARMYITIAVGR